MDAREEIDGVIFPGGNLFESPVDGAWSDAHIEHYARLRDAILAAGYRKMPDREELSDRLTRIVASGNAKNGFVELDAYSLADAILALMEGNK